MLARLLLAHVLANLPVDVKAGESPLTAMRVTPAADGLNLEWSDTEDVLRGIMKPRHPRANEPLTIEVHVDSYRGEPFGGPITVALRPLEAMGGAQSVTVPLQPHEKMWRITLTPPDRGEYRLEVSWRTTRLKAVRSTLTVEEPRLPAWLLGVVGGGLILVASGGGAWFLLRRQRQENAS